MLTPSAPSATPASRSSQLAELVLAAPVVTAQAVDFRKGTWTFSLPAVPVGPGDYKVVRATDALYALACDQQQPQGVVLPPTAPCRDVTHWTDDGTDYLRIEAADFDVSLYRERLPSERYPEQWRGAGVWYGCETRTDTQGRRWVRSIRRMVDDSYGNLVEVTA